MKRLIRLFCLIAAATALGSCARDKVIPDEELAQLKKQVKEYDVIKRNIDSILRRESEPERGKENVRG